MQWTDLTAHVLEELASGAIRTILKAVLLTHRGPAGLSAQLPAAAEDDIANARRTSGSSRASRSIRARWIATLHTPWRSQH